MEAASASRRAHVMGTRRRHTKVCGEARRRYLQLATPRYPSAGDTADEDDRAGRARRAGRGLDGDRERGHLARPRDGHDAGGERTVALEREDAGRLGGTITANRPELVRAAFPGIGEIREHDRALARRRVDDDSPAA